MLISAVWETVSACPRPDPPLVLPSFHPVLPTFHQSPQASPLLVLPNAEGQCWPCCIQLKLKKVSYSTFVTLSAGGVSALPAQGIMGWPLVQSAIAAKMSVDT